MTVQKFKETEITKANLQTVAGLYGINTKKALSQKEKFYSRPTLSLPAEDHFNANLSPFYGPSKIILEFSNYLP